MQLSQHPPAAHEDTLAQTASTAAPRYATSVWQVKRGPHRSGAVTAGDLRSEEGQRLVDEHHRKYVDALRALYDAHKEQYAPARRRSLDIVQ